MIAKYVGEMWEREMRDRLGVKNERIAELERKVELLEAFVAAADEVADDAPMEGDMWFPSSKRNAMMERYEAKRGAVDWVPRS